MSNKKPGVLDIFSVIILSGLTISVLLLTGTILVAVIGYFNN